MEIDTVNDSLVATQGDAVIIIRPRAKLTKEEALRLAAYLVLMADPSEEQFPKVLEAIKNT